PAEVVPAPPGAPWRPERVPSRGALAADAVADAARSINGVPALVMRTARGVRAARAVRRSHPNVPSATPLNTPRTVFNGALTPRRTFATVSVPLERVQVVRRALTVTVNDVVLAMCAGALVAYLDGHGGRPSKPLLAGVPVAVDGPTDTPRLTGNNV